MSAPKKIVLPDGRVRYEIVYDIGRDPETGKRRQKTKRFERRKDADAELARVRHQRATGSYVPPSRLTVAAMLDEFLASATFEREEATRSNYVHALRVPRARLGERLVQDITRQDVESLRDFMLTGARKRGGQPGTGLGARSVRLAISRLSAAFEQAVDDGKLTRNPCRGVRLPRLDQREKEAWTEDEARQFLAEASRDRLHAAWRMLMYAGRRQEVCGARWADIDLAAGTWSISGVRNVVDGKVITKERPKSDSSRRTLPLDGALVAALTALRKHQAAEKLAAGETYQAGLSALRWWTQDTGGNLVPVPAGAGYVVTDELGIPVNPEWLSDEFERVAGRAGVRRMTPHNARHTALTLMEQAGLPVSFIAAWAGHKDHSFTMKRYVHKPADLSAARDALSQLYGG